MSGSAFGFNPDIQQWAQQAWEGWLRQWQSASSVRSATLDDLGGRSNVALASFMEWLQRSLMMMSSMPSFNPAPANPWENWQARVQQWFAPQHQPFPSSFGGWCQPGASGFAQLWQNWLQAAQIAGLSGLHSESMIPVGYGREFQRQQQELQAAMQEYFAILQQYQSLIQQAMSDALERLQKRLGEGVQDIGSMRKLYDAWIDAAEEAYAEIAMSEEFRKVYGEMVNAQMRVRKLQQDITMYYCRELGIPTRAEVNSLGQRVQELRRELALLKTAAHQTMPAIVSKPKAVSSVGNNQAKAKTVAKTRVAKALRVGPELAG